MLDRRRWAAFPRSLACIALLVLAASARGAIPGDLDGDGVVDLPDLLRLLEVYESSRGGDRYDPAGDLDGDGVIDSGDAALIYQSIGNVGPADVAEPGLVVSLDRIPEDQNDLLVVPPGGFRITLEFDSAGGSLVDGASLVVSSDTAFGPHPAGTDLASQFVVSPARAVWEVPAALDLERRNPSLTVSVRDHAGNAATREYAFAVRDFVAGAPLGASQTLFLDFDQDRNPIAGSDFVESLREFGLSDPSAPDVEAALRTLAIAQITAKVRQQYGLQPNGARGPDSPDLIFVWTRPPGAHSRICIGGESPDGPRILGFVSYDANNLNLASDECAIAPRFGVFPHAIDDLWGADPDFRATFDAMDPDLGGTPIGLHPADDAILVPGFDRAGATPVQVARLTAIVNAFHAFTWAVATATSHEIGHMLGLTAEGRPGGGLFGDGLNHNRTAGGERPRGNWVMNEGSSFRFSQVAALPSEGSPRFRPLSWAYLRNRLAPNPLVTALFPPPSVDAIEPASLAFEGQLATFTLRGSGFRPGEPPTLELVRAGSPPPGPVFSVTVVDRGTVTGVVNRLFLTPGPYDLRVTNPDAQMVTVADAIRIP